ESLVSLRRDVQRTKPCEVYYAQSLDWCNLGTLPRHLDGIRSIHQGAYSMRNSGRLKMIGFLLCVLLVAAPASWAQAPQRAPILEKVAKTYGIDSWDQVESIRYTWNADIPGLFKAAHKWEWEPKTGKVTFEGTDKDGKPVKVTYDSSHLSSQ